MTGKGMKGTIRIMAALAALTGFAQGAEARNCLGLGDDYYNDPSGRCYYIETTPADYTVAQAACAANGGNLATISSAAEQSAVQAAFSGQGELFIGGSDSASEGNWVWGPGDLESQVFWQGLDTGSSPNGLYTNWQTGQPNNAGQDCLSLHTNTAGTWYDTGCVVGTIGGYMCELYACTNPVGDQGEVIFNRDSRTLQYCNGGTWISMAQPVYAPTAVAFDGINDYMTTASAQGADSQAITGSFWIKYSSNSSPYTIVGQNGIGAFRISYGGGSGNRLDIIGRRGSDSTIVLQARCGGAQPDVGVWYHYVFSVDLSDVNNRHCYVNDASSYTSLTYLTGETMNFDIASTRIGANNDGPASNKFDGSIADMWLDFGTYIDLSVEGNRRKFIDSAGRPADMGDDGSLPTGSQPEIFLSGAVGAWHTNKGTATGYTLTGALDADTAPGVLDTGVVESGLVGYWPLDDISGGTAVESTGGFNGTYVNSPAATSGQVGLGRSFVPASLQHVSIPHDARYNLSDYTLATWVFSNTPSDGSAIDISNKIIDKDRNFTMNWDHQFIGGVSCEHNDGVSWINTAGTAPPALNAGQWYHIACTYDADSSDYILYVDGVAVNTNGTAPAPLTDTDNIAIGSLHHGGSDFFEGTIDDVRIYNRTLSPAEIAEIYNWGSAGGSLCQNPARPTGTLLFNDDSNVPQFCDGTTWRALGPVPGPGGAGCTSPSRGEGFILFNSTARVMQYCDGVNWRAMPGMGLSAPTEGLVHHWPMEDTVASGTIADVVGGADCTTFANGGSRTSVAGKEGNALNFVTAYATCGTIPAIHDTQTLTLSAWLKRNALGALVSVGDAEEVTQLNQIIVNFWNADTFFSITSPPADGWEEGSYALNDTEWHLLTLVYDGTQTGNANRLKGYINGQPVTLTYTGTIPASASPLANAQPFTMFRYASSYNGNGAIDDVRIYDRPLTDAEVSQLYYATGGN